MTAIAGEPEGKAKFKYKSEFVLAGITKFTLVIIMLAGVELVVVPVKYESDFIVYTVSIFVSPSRNFGVY